MPTAITSVDDFDVTSDKHVVVFSASWCGPCQKLKPSVVELEAEFNDVTFRTVDVDVVPDLAQSFDVLTVPTAVFFHQGQVTNRIVGGHPKRTYSEALQELTRDD